jgi:UDP-N-acetyl-D-galactosamine dehydrogenase
MNITKTIEKIENKSAHISIIGLGYVGLPLAAEFGKAFPTLGFDVNSDRIAELENGTDRTLELTSDKLKAASQLQFTASAEALSGTDIFIITVPTPIDSASQPDLTCIRQASELVGKVLKPGAFVIYESTVYPGCTEEVCVPILEKCSGLTFNRDFYCGYSPERINPGDKKHTLTKIMKVTSGSTPEAGQGIDMLYRCVIEAGTYLASSIQVAEAAKVIENCQRDLNIAFVNELSKIFDIMKIDTLDVLKAAGTKWNFLPFRPGLVGGHCIGVDPYYLTHKAHQLGYHSRVILAGRELNDGMGKDVAQRVIKLMIKEGIQINASRALVLGITFKENCPDVRNSRIVDVIEELANFGVTTEIHDPWANPEVVRKEYGLNLMKPNDFGKKSFDAIILAVPHNEFIGLDFRSMRNEHSVLYDLKGILPPEESDGRM